MVQKWVYRVTCICLMAMASVQSARATSIVLPTDDQLITKSPVVIEGIVLDSKPVRRGSGIWTETTISVQRQLKGKPVGSTVTVREVGGQIGDDITVLFGAPKFTAGEKVLTFLTPTRRGDYQTTDLFVGKFNSETTRSGRRVWLRDNSAENTTLLDSNFHPIRVKNVLRDAGAFDRYIRVRAAGEKGDRRYGIDRDEADKSPEDGLVVVSQPFTMISEPTIYRWKAFDTGGSAAWYSKGTQPGYSGGGVNELQTAMNAWTGYSQANIHYTYAGVSSVAPGGLTARNNVNEVLLNDPLSEIAGSWNPSTGGVVGQGGFNGVASGGSWTSPFAADAAHPQKTYTSYAITEANLTIQDNVSPQAGISSQTLAEITAHEFGHTLGFGHSSENPSESDPNLKGALMYYMVTGAGPSLRSDDQMAARWLYPLAGGSTVTTVPSAPSGLTGSAASSSSVALGWLDNASNETAQYVYMSNGGGFNRVASLGANVTSATISGLSAATYQFYVTAANSAGESTGSNTVSVTISPTVAQVQAAFAVSPSSRSGTAGVTTFGFTDQSMGPVASRNWSFGDGATSTAANPNHLYANAGNYTVTLTVAGSGSQSSTQQLISVASQTPATVPVSASFTMSATSIQAGGSVTFTDQSSGSPTGWQWTFGDGGSSTAKNPSHAFANAGTYTITLVARNSTTSGSASASLYVAAAAPALTTFRSLVPVTAQTDGVGGSQWRTELSIFNAGSAYESIQLLFIPGAGGTILNRAVSIGPRQTLDYANALPDIFGLASGAGAVAIQATNSSTPDLKISSRTFTNSPVGTYGQFVPDVVGDDISQTTYMTGLESDAGYRTNLGLVNRSAASVNVTLTLLNANGSTIGTSNQTLGANSFQQAALGSYFGAVNGASLSNLTVRVVASSGNAVTAYTSIVDNRTQDPVYVQAAAPKSSGELFIPAVGRVAGANGTYWRSDVTLYNPNSAPLTLTLGFLASGRSNTQPQLRTLVVAAGRTVTLTDLLSWIGAGDGTGALQITWTGAANGPITTSRTYTTRVSDNGTFGQSIDATQKFVSNAFVTGLRSDSTYRTNVGFVNSGYATIGVTVTLVNVWGQTLGTGFVSVPARSQSQSSLASIFPGVNVSGIGSLTVQAQTDSGPTMFVYGSVVDNISGDPIFIAGE
ncbi:MAG TPA: PKD domain-containing protein [Thermoanaerobaculia bacterium]|nr:PKD domain-containing protein [Thermoanaerobaculia bacterium]